MNYNWFTDFPDTLNSFDPQWPGFPVFGGQTSMRLSWSNSVRSTLGRNLVNEARVGYSGSPVKFFDEMNVDMFTGIARQPEGLPPELPERRRAADRCRRGAGAAVAQRHGPGDRRHADLAEGQPQPDQRRVLDLFNGWFKNSTWCRGQLRPSGD